MRYALTEASDLRRTTPLTLSASASADRTILAMSSSNVSSSGVSAGRVMYEVRPALCSGLYTKEQSLRCGMGSVGLGAGTVRAQRLGTHRPNGLLLVGRTPVAYW